MYRVELLKNSETVKYAEDSERAEIEIRAEAGDIIRFSSDEERFLCICIEPAAYEAVIYAQDGCFDFEIPSGKRLCGFEQGVFDGELKAYIRKAEADYRDLALNPYDIFTNEEVVPWDAPEWANPEHSPAVEGGKVKAFPHVFASRVTRDEGCFFARNAIDGKAVGGGHGNYPYHSWGGGVHNDLSIAVYFGRKVRADKLLLNLRSDYSVDGEGFEHDTYWKRATLEFSDGSSITVSPEKTDADQIFEFEPRVTEWVLLKELVPYVNPKGHNFAALNKIGIYGSEI